MWRWLHLIFKDHNDPPKVSRRYAAKSFVETIAIQVVVRHSPISKA
jgi:hypothetical protein